MWMLKTKNKQKVGDPKIDRLKTVSKVKQIGNWIRNVKNNLVG